MKKFKALIVKYNLDTTQKEILKGVSDKFAEMMDCEASQIDRLAA